MRVRFLFVLLAACGSDSASNTAPGSAEDAGGGAEAGVPGADAQPPVDAGSDASASDAPAPGCPRTPGDPNAPRKVVVSHPFGANAGDKAKTFELVDLAADGTMSHPATKVTFEMGTALDSPIVFTPDGAVGLVAQDDGSIGVFRLDASGTPTVVHAAFKQGFMHPESSWIRAARARG
jgi:hypothetical protein